MKYAERKKHREVSAISETMRARTPSGIETRKIRIISAGGTFPTQAKKASLACRLRGHNRGDKLRDRGDNRILLLAPQLRIDGDAEAFGGQSFAHRQGWRRADCGREALLQMQR